MTNQTDIAWLAGIADGEGCFSVKRPSRSVHSFVLWFVLCNTSLPMMERVARILKDAGVAHAPMRKVWKGDRATRWQYWINVSRKHELLKLTELLLPHLTAKKCEGEIVAWFLRKACAPNAKYKNYHQTDLDRAVMSTMSAIKRNGGEAPPEAEELLRAVIPSEAFFGHHEASGVEKERVETRSLSPNNNATHECPAPLRLLAR
jgi:hypothetical protein